MNDLNQMIKKVFNKPQVIQERIPKGFEKNCECSFSHPDFVFGKTIFIEDSKTRKRWYHVIPCSRFYCPKCGTELTKILEV
jgi:hypothetical protein